VSRHTSAVTDVVTNVVSDRCRVTGIIFRNTGFDFTDEVGTDIRTLGEDTAAETGEARNQRCTKTEANKTLELGARLKTHFRKHDVIMNQTYQTQAYVLHPGDGTGGEGDVERFVQAFGRGLRRADV